MLPVVEQFLSVQGESTYAGKVCYFIRLAGCNLRCSYCDTAYAFSEKESSFLSVEEIAANALSSRAGVVEVTGGEPLLHPETPLLCEKLQASGLTVLVETNGTLDISRLPSGIVRIMDVKSPSSGMSGYFLESNMKQLTTDDEVKFVLSDRSDFDHAVQTADRYALNTRVNAVHFSPVSGKLSAAELASWMVEARLPYTLHLQLHKIIWPGVDKGV